MISVTPAPEPSEFDAQVRQPGRRAIERLIAQGTPPDEVFRQVPSLWRKALPDLMKAYDEICAYSCFRIHRVTGSASADHMAPKSRERCLIYEWSNYRLACSRLNSRKRNWLDVLDPFEISRGWFRIELNGFQVCPGLGLSGKARARVQATISRLKLNDYAFRTTREEHTEDYWAGRICFEVLMRESPFVAMELQRQNRLAEEGGPGD